MVGAETTSIHLLLVDDDEINRVVTGRLLKHAGFTVTTAASGPQAIELLRSVAVDAVLMDVSMPGMDGLEATRLIRSTLPVPRCTVPVVALTAFDAETERERCAAAGMNAFVTKPVQTTDLAEIIGNLIRSDA